MATLATNGLNSHGFMLVLHTVPYIEKIKIRPLPATKNTVSPDRTGAGVGATVLKRRTYQVMAQNISKGSHVLPVTLKESMLASLNTQY